MGEIRKHWNNWFHIAAVGLNTIRIQIGFWSVIPLQNGEPFLVGAYDYLKLAVTWAASLNLKVMVDLHGVPRGQNGFDNSGIRDVRQWFYNDTNISRTLSALQVLTSEFSQSFYNNTVVAIELVNEPFPQNSYELNVLKSFYQAAYGTVQGASSQSGLVITMMSPWTLSAALQYPGDCSVKTGSDPSKFSAKYVDYLAKSFETQTWVYEQASGWVMWTWKTERAADWSMQTGITYGWIPNPISSKPHGIPCTGRTTITSAPANGGGLKSEVCWWGLLLGSLISFLL
ncbi:hypothetical protein IAT38_006271 [Cryptococcus sp. DSM 104549]